MNQPHLSYSQLLENIPEIKRFFKVAYLKVPNEDFPLLKLYKIFSPKHPLVILMAGCHGEEPAPTLTIFQNYQLILEKAKESRINVIIYPLINPWGFDRNKRNNRLNLNCNSNWIHPDKDPLAKEVKMIKQDIKRHSPLIFVSLHEDDDTEKEFYLYSFGDKKYGQELIETGCRYFPILPDGSYGQYQKPDDFTIEKGAAHNHHDGSCEDFMSHQGCQFSCCTETPSHQPLSKRIKCNTEIILKVIELAHENKNGPKL